MPYYDADYINNRKLERDDPYSRPLWVPSQPISLDTDIYEVDSSVLAKELTSYESELYFQVTRLDCELSAKNGPTGPVADIVQTQDLIARWVLKSILSLNSVDSRAKAIDAWLNTAWHCCRLANYSTPYAILRALGSDHLGALDLTTGNIDRRDCLYDLQVRLDKSNNYAKVRALLADRRKLTYCVPPLEAYFEFFDMPIVISYYLCKQSFSDAPITDEIPAHEADLNQQRPRFAFNKNQFAHTFLIESLKHVETVPEDWFDHRSQQLQEAEAEQDAQSYY